MVKYDKSIFAIIKKMDELWTDDEFVQIAEKMMLDDELEFESSSEISIHENERIPSFEYEKNHSFKCSIRQLSFEHFAKAA